MGASGLPGHAIQHCQYGTVGRSRRNLRTDEPIPAQGRLEEFVVEVLVHEIASRQRGDSHEFPHVLLAHATNIEPQVSEGHQVRQAAAANTWHRLQPERLQRSGESVHKPAVVLVSARVVGTGATQGVPVNDDVFLVAAQSDDR